MPAQPQVSDHKSGLAIAEQLAAELADYAALPPRPSYAETVGESNSPKAQVISGADLEATGKLQKEDATFAELAAAGHGFGTPP